MLAASSWALAPGCPKPPPLPPPPVGAGGPATQSLAERDQRIDAVRANAVIRTRVPEGRPGAPGGKLTAIVLAAARPPRARLEVLTPLGTPAATILLADGLFQVYDPFAHRLTKASLDSPEIAAQLGAIPIPLERLPSLLRGVVPLEPGEVTERLAEPEPSDGASADASASEEPEEVLVEVRRDGRLVQQVRVHRSGGYPLEEVRFDPQTGLPASRIAFSSYGGAPSPEGPVAFPQKITARVYEPAVTGSVESASVELRLSRIEVDPALPEDSFRLEFDRPPEVREM